ncbi:hypothetical protein EYF80_002160 [Liparis tanakae]|uniref:Uncharacterized protein n=1 Tax=Liparis tanakae TaxID=230148 RepID=A0A4Z2JCE3_9TELE|nr:hypothetical protein EYF80_002160 [Liparis tanakae]
MKTAAQDDTPPPPLLSVSRGRTESTLGLCKSHARSPESLLPTAPQSSASVLIAMSRQADARPDESYATQKIEKLNMNHITLSYSAQVENELFGIWEPTIRQLFSHLNDAVGHTMNLLQPGIKDSRVQQFKKDIWDYPIGEYGR